MKRPEQHETDSAADALLRSVFYQWVVTPSERDYGWDYVVEVFRNGESTGLLFNVQLKGSMHTEYSASGSFISQELEIDSADYLSRQLRLPTFLVHADVKASKLYWTAIQLDQKVLEILEQGKAKSLTVRIPTANLLPDKFDRFARDLAQAQTVVVSRILMETTPFDFVEAMKSQPKRSVNRAAEDLHEKAYRLELDAAFQQRKSGDIEGALTAILKVAASAGAGGHTEVQFNAVLQAGELEWVLVWKSNAPQARAADTKLKTAFELCRIAKRKPRNLHLFAQISRRAAELAVEAHKTLGLLMAWRGHVKRGEDPVWIAVLSFQVQQSLLATHKKYNQTLRLAGAAARSPYRWITTRPVADVALAIGGLAGVLESCDFTQAAEQYRQSAFRLLKFSAAVATENKSMDELFNAVMNARMLERNPDGDIFKWIRSIVDGWSEGSEYRKNAEKLISKWLARKAGATFEGDVETNYLQIHQNILTSAGIDPTEEPWASLIELAIRDEDPTRVLIECEHKAIMQLGNQMLVRLGLERANPKRIVCSLHRYSLVGAALDDINAEFKKLYCDSCPDKCARPDLWNFYDGVSRKPEA